MEDTKQKLLDIINNQFGASFGLDTSIDDIDKWDSLTHMILITKIENQFDIKFDLMDMLNFDSISSIYQAILRTIE